VWGVGGEGTFLANNYGFHDVTVADMSENALENCKPFDPRLKTRLLARLLSGQCAPWLALLIFVRASCRSLGSESAAVMEWPPAWISMTR
jgi:hypothetical protein